MLKKSNLINPIEIILHITLLSILIFSSILMIPLITSKNLKKGNQSLLSLEIQSPEILKKTSNFFSLHEIKANCEKDQILTTHSQKIKLQLEICENVTPQYVQIELDNANKKTNKKIIAFINPYNHTIETEYFETQKSQLLKIFYLYPDFAQDQLFKIVNIKKNWIQNITIHQKLE